MGNFVSGNTPLPPAKQDAYPPTGLATELDASDINNLWSAAGDLRTAVFGSRPVVNVKQPPYSAVGNGIADDTAAFQAAIAAAQTAKGTLYVPPGTYKISTALTATGINIVGEGGAAFTTSTTEVDFYGTGASLTFAASGSGSGVRLEGLWFVSKGAGQTGAIIEGQSNVIRNLGFKDFDTVGFQMGIAGVAGAYYNDVANVVVSNAVQGAVGVLVSGGFPSTNANHFRNIVVNGKFTTMFQIDGVKNIFWDGDCDPNTTGTGVSDLWKISGTNNEVHGSYVENGGGTVPLRFINFTSTSNSNIITGLNVTVGMSFWQNQTAAITDLGWNNRVDILPTGFNFPMTTFNRGSANLVPNSGFQQFDSSGVGQPRGWVNFGLAGDWVQDASTTHGTSMSVKATGAGTNVNLTAFFASPSVGDKSLNQMPIGYFQGKQVTCSVWCKSSFAGQGNLRVTSDGTGGLAYGQMFHTGGGGWELLVATSLIPVDATKVGIAFRNTNGGSTLTGNIWFSEPMCVVGPEVPHYSPRSLTDSIAQLMGPLSLNPPIALTFGASINTDASLGNQFSVNATSNAAFAFLVPSNLTRPGQHLAYQIKNTSGGVIATPTWNAVFKLPTLVLPATGFNRTYDFMYDGTNLVFQWQTASDVPN